MIVIGARKTLFSSVDAETARDFVNTHHRQGMARPGSSSVSYGLYYDEELLGVAIFCNPRTRAMQRKYTTELFRLAFKENIRVPGGASKLIKGFIRIKQPANLFTYQSTEGESGNVYEKSGMTLVKEAKEKKILLRAGINLQDKKNNRKDWFSLEQAATRGPDALLGTTLGEVFDASGKRKSNLLLFQEELGYRLITVPGDRIYEWENPEVSFYTYKITNISNDFYYYGRKIIRGKDSTVIDCLNDGYYGSGGYAFKRWLNSQSKDSILKEILGIYPSWRDVVKAEKKLIGNLYKTDPFCLNAKPGGTGITQLSFPSSFKKCHIHGKVLHMGNSCCSCTTAKGILEKNCSIHGLTVFRGNHCAKCIANKSLNQRFCIEHGESTHRGESCIACKNSSAYVERNCGRHGFTLHQGNRCRSCISEESFITAKCPIHGETIHQGVQCRKCLNKKNDSLRECPSHGVSVHRGKLCLKCAVAKTINISECKIHGLVKHQNNQCLSCKNASSWTLQKCKIHGESSFYGGNCRSCAAQEKELKSCSIHGKVKHTGDTCYKCEAEKRNKIKVCDIHGETSFQGDFCRKCLIAKQFEEKECPNHGLVKHRNGKCSKCHTANMLKTLNCDIHGPTVHRGKQCLTCLNSRLLLEKLSEVSCTT